MSGDEAPAQSLACRWFAVRAEYERVNSPVLIWRTVWAALKGLLTLWLFSADLEPKRFCDVIVFRRDTGSNVLVYQYEELGDGTQHFENLTERLSSTHIFDFCRELGISTTEVVGPGLDTADSGTAPGWSAVSRRDRLPEATSDSS